MFATNLRRPPKETPPAGDPEGGATKTPIREILPAGAQWTMARSARAAMVGLYRAGVKFRRPWEPPPLEPWEGPFADPNQRLPQEPSVAAERRAAQQRWRQRQRARKAANAVGCDEAANADVPA